jgi:hypothetical protein
MSVLLLVKLLSQQPNRDWHTLLLLLYVLISCC